MVYKRAIYAFDKNILIGISYPVSESDRKWRGPGYQDNGVPLLEPKLKYIRENVEFAGEYSLDDLIKQNICAHITFKQAEESDIDISIRTTKNEVPKPYLDVTVSGNLTELEAANLAHQVTGQRAVNLESIICRTLNIAAARDGYMAIHGGATVDTENKEVYVVLSKEHGVGKTGILLNLLQHGQKFISNNIKFRILKSGRIYIYPQYYPKKVAQIKTPKQANYEKLKAKGFKPEDYGIKEILRDSKEAEVPLGPNESILVIPTIEDRLELTDDYKLIAIWPKPTSDVVENQLNIYEPVSKGDSIDSVWFATWSFAPILDELKISSESKRSKINNILTDFINTVVQEQRSKDGESKERPFQQAIIQKIGPHFFEVAGDYNCILPEVKAKIKQLAQAEPPAQATISSSDEEE